MVNWPSNCTWVTASGETTTEIGKFLTFQQTLLPLQLWWNTLGTSAGNPAGPSHRAACWIRQRAGNRQKETLCFSYGSRLTCGTQCHHGSQKHKCAQEVLRCGCGRLWTWRAINHRCNPWHRGSLNRRLGWHGGEAVATGLGVSPQPLAEIRCQARCACGLAWDSQP